MSMKPINHGDKGKKNITISWTSGFVASHIDPDCAKGMRSARVQQLCAMALGMHHKNRHAIRGSLSKYEHAKSTCLVLSVMFDPIVTGTIAEFTIAGDTFHTDAQNFIEENEVLLGVKYNVDTKEVVATLERLLWDCGASIMPTIVDCVQRYHLHYHQWEQGERSAKPDISKLFSEEQNNGEA